MKIWSAILYLCSVILYLDIDILIIKIYNLSLREGHQGKHILGHNNYLKGRSYISNATMEEIQQCISTHAGKGIIQRTANGNWNNK